MSEADVDKKTKSPHAEREERVLSMWKDKDIFNKSLEKNKNGKEFVFFEGPPTANGRPGIHHLEARAFKDAIPRYKTMQGFYVRRKGGWDTHGLPVELQVEKELGLKSKKEIEVYGIAAFNEKCKESVWKYVHEWEDFTNRMGYWIDLKNPYVTYKPQYIESVWNIIKTTDEKKLLYKDYKVVPWCPRCGTGLSSHELAQGYEEVKDLTLYVKFRVKAEKKTHFLAWTTTPWTLPGNVGLAVGKDIDYVEVKIGDEFLILAKERLSVLKDVQYQMGETKKGSELAGLSYEPLFPFLQDNLSATEKEKLPNAFKVYTADFVTTTDGTGIVHIAPMYGQDDFELGTKVNLPKHHLVNDDGTFKKECGFLAGRFVKEKDENGKPTLDVDIVNELKKNNAFFAQENHKHDYPHCWRCHTPLIYFARDSWYIRMSSLRDELVKQNEGIHWEPEHIKEGRFGDWLREVKDWAISRERYWGTPLPIWSCDKCPERKVVGSVEDLKKPSRNTYHMMRHGESENNVLGQLNSDVSKVFHLTELGKKEVRESAQAFKGKIDVVYASPLIRAQETAGIVAEVLGLPVSSIITDDRLHEMTMGELEGRPLEEFLKLYPHREDFFRHSVHGVESRISNKQRVGTFIEEIDKNNEGKRILIVSHDSPLWMLQSAAQGLNIRQTLELKPSGTYFLKNAEVRAFEYHGLPHDHEYELDLHRPFIDEVIFACSCGGTMKRAKEVMDVWFDSGAMPFAQDHYPFETENRGIVSKLLGKKQELTYPADFISEAIDQTRGWFYTLHAIGALMGKGKAYKNVICLGHILDAEGKKMSKSIGNVVNPWDMMDLYGADALRFWMYSVNQPGDSKNFDVKTVDEIIKKVFNLVANVTSFYKMYEGQESRDKVEESKNVLDTWILTRLDEVVATVTKGLDGYVFLEPTRTIRDFIADLSQWYLRRSRDRFKGDDQTDKQAALATTQHVLLTLAKLMAPFTPFFAEFIYSEVGGEKESVHLEEWPKATAINEKLIADMNKVRTLSSKGLEARMKVKINVRQPLRILNVKEFMTLEEGLLDLIRDEVNVKEVAFGLTLESDVTLDTTITLELKEEGDLRELVRSIQDLRKEKGLSVGDKVKVMVPESNRALVGKYSPEIKKVANLTDIQIGENLSIIA